MERYTSLTKERLLNFKARVNEASIVKVLTFLNEDGTGHDISALGFEIPVYKTPFARNPIFTLTVGDGLEIQGADNHQLAISVTAARATLQPDVYFARVYSSEEDHTWLNGDWAFHNGKYDGVIETDDIVIYENGGDVTIVVTTQGISQATLNAALALKADLALSIGDYSAELTFDVDKDIFQDVTGLSPVFTLNDEGNINGVGIILRLNKPTAVTFPANFEAGENSATLDATKLNVFMLVYFSNWNGTGTPRVIYNNSLFTAI